jgi:hypothetical protein
LSIDNPTVIESIGTIQANIHRNTPTTASLTIELGSDNPNKATVPESVTIVEGADATSITITIVDNTITDGVQTATIQANAVDFVANTILLEIVDDDGWQNLVNRLDVNIDGFLAPIDALLVINELNQPQYVNTSGELPALRPADAPRYDVNGDGSVAPIDALLIINELNNGGQAEGERAWAELRLLAAIGILANRSATSDRNGIGELCDEPRPIPVEPIDAELREVYPFRSSDCNVWDAVDNTEADDLESVLKEITEDIANELAGRLYRD